MGETQAIHTRMGYLHHPSFLWNCQFFRLCVSLPPTMVTGISCRPLRFLDESMRSRWMLRQRHCRMSFWLFSITLFFYSSINGIVALVLSDRAPWQRRRQGWMRRPRFMVALPHPDRDDSPLISRLDQLFESPSSHGDNLPIYDVLPLVKKSMSTKPNLLLEAPPGAGKTTVVPLVILWWRFVVIATHSNHQQHDQERLSQQIWLVEPRRVAVRSAATRMSTLLEEVTVGGTVGYQIRGESRGGGDTRINVVTDGILLQRLRLDPELKGINVIIFDEFHERGIDSDVALALCKQTQQLWRKDLQIVVMSATLLGSSKPRADKNGGDSRSPAAKLVRALGGTEHCDIVRSNGRQYPITVYHSSDLKWSQQARPLPLRVLQKDRKELVNAMCDVIEQGIKRAPAKGDVLAFLPGAAEIRRTVQQLSGILPSDIEVVPLYGALSKEDQDYALFPKSGDNRRVIVSSPIAEASLTLERVTCVVDSGLRREPRCDVDTNMPRLVTTICSKASATQRAGRAGRVQEGLCLRIYTESEFEDGMAEDGDPEILSTDLCPTTLLLVDWGCSNQEEILHEIPFVDPPPKESLETAIRLLTELGALRDEDNRLSITKLGQEVAAIPTHPRIATVLQTARERNDPSALAAAVAVAFLLDDDTSIGALNSGPNLVERVTSLYRRTIDAESSLLKKSFLRYAARIGEDAKSAAAGVFQGETPLVEVAAAIGPALLPGFIDLIGERKGDASYGASTYLLSLGRSARLDNYGASNVEIPPYVVVVETSTGDDGKVRIRAFAAIAKEVLMEWSTECEIAFTVPSRGHEVRARRVRRIGSLELDSTPLPSPSPEKVTEILKETIKSLGGFDRALTQTMGPEERATVENLFQRVRLAAKLTRDDDKSWPSVFLSPDNPDDEGNEGAWGALVEPWLAAAGSLKKVDLLTILQSSLSPEQQYQLDKDFPTMIQAPDGSQIPVSYSTDPPSATAKLQQFFGTSESPRVGPIHRPISVSLSLLSPAGKVVAQTIDLSFFWSETYPQVRAELRGRYAKHPWPEDPITAKATRQTKKQMDAATIIPNMSEKESSSGSQKKRSKRR